MFSIGTCHILELFRFSVVESTMLMVPKTCFIINEWVKQCWAARKSWSPIRRASSVRFGFVIHWIPDCPHLITSRDTVALADELFMVPKVLSAIHGLCFIYSAMDLYYHAAAWPHGVLDADTPASRGLKIALLCRKTNGLKSLVKNWDTNFQSPLTLAPWNPFS